MAVVELLDRNVSLGAAGPDASSSSYPKEDYLQGYEPPPPLGSPPAFAPAAPIWKVQFDSQNNAYQVVRTSDMVRWVNLV